MAVAAARIEQFDGSFEDASSVLQRIGKLQKQAAVAHNPLSNGNALDDLRLAILAFAQIYVSPAKLVCAGSDVDKRLVIVIAQHGCVWQRNDIGEYSGRHSDGAIHISFQLLARVIHNDARLQRSGAWIERR